MSALLVLLQTNFWIGFLLFTLFSFLRERYPKVYSPRTFTPSGALRKDVESLPSGLFTWIIPLIQVPYPTVVREGGMDATMYVRFFALCFRFFGIVSVLGVGLMWINSLGHDEFLSDVDFWTIANIPPQSSLFWHHLFVAYLLTFVAFILLRKEYQAYQALRYRYLQVRQNSLVSRSVLVQNIPTSIQSDADLAQFFRSVFPDTFEAGYLNKDILVLEDLVRQRAQVSAELIEAEIRAGGRYRGEDITLRRAQLLHLDELIAAERSKQHKPVSTGFVTFTTSLDARIAFRLPVSEIPYSFDVQPAPEPRDLIWANLYHSRTMRSLRQAIAMASVSLLFVLWTIPVGFVASLTTLSNLTSVFPFLIPIVHGHASVRQLLESFLSTVTLTLFIMILPFILEALARFQGEESVSSLERNVFRRFFIFIVLEFFFLNTLGASLLSILEEFIERPDLGSLVRLLGQSIPEYSTFFCSYIVLNAFVAFPVYLINFGDLLRARTGRSKKVGHEGWYFNYGIEYPSYLLVFVIGVCYSTIAPIISLFACMFFGVGYIFVKYQVLFVASPRYESGGLCWPLVFSRMVVGLICFQGTFMGVLGLKGCAFQATLVAPLIGATVFFYHDMVSAYEERSCYLPLNLARRKAHGYARYSSMEPANSDLDLSLLARPPALEPESERRLSNADHGSESLLVGERFEESTQSTYVHPSLTEMVTTTYRVPAIPNRKSNFEDSIDPLELLQVS